VIELLILEDAVLLNIARNPNFLREFPVLHTIAQPQAGVAVLTRGCGGCSGAAAKPNLNAVKHSITQLPADRKRVLLQMLGAKKVRVVLSIAGRITNYDIVAT